MPKLSATEAAAVARLSALSAGVRLTKADLDLLHGLKKAGRLPDRLFDELRRATERGPKAEAKPARPPRKGGGKNPGKGGGSGQPPAVPPPPPVAEPPAPVPPASEPPPVVVEPPPVVAEPPPVVAEPPPVVLPAPLKMGTPGTRYVVRAGETLEGWDLGAGSTVELNGDGARVIGCKIHDTAPRSIAIFVNKGKGCEVAYNEVYNLRGRGISVQATGDVSEPWIHHNHVHDAIVVPGDDAANGEGERANARELVQLGMGKAETSLRARLEDNLLERGSIDREAVSVKSLDNLIQRNTLRDCKGSFLSARHGERQRILANVCERSGGIVLLGGPHWVAWNVVGDGDIVEMWGDMRQEDWGRSFGYPAACNVTYAGNDKAAVRGTFKGRDVEPWGNGPGDCGPAMVAAAIGADACGCMAARA